MKLSLPPEERVALCRPRRPRRACCGSGGACRRFYSERTACRWRRLPRRWLARRPACRTGSPGGARTGWQVSSKGDIRARRVAWSLPSRRRWMRCSPRAIPTPRRMRRLDGRFPFPLLRTQLGKQGWQASERTIRRTLRRLGWRWKRPKFVLGRPDPASAEKKSGAEHAAAMVAAGGEVWFGDETTVREFPPLRAAWARCGQQQIVVLSGRNSRRVAHGALNVATGDLVTLVRERSRQDDCVAFLEALAQVHPAVPKLFVWDNAPPHQPKRTSPSGFRLPSSRRTSTSSSCSCPFGRPNCGRAKTCGGSPRPWSPPPVPTQRSKRRPNASWGGSPRSFRSTASSKPASVAQSFNGYLLSILLVARACSQTVSVKNHIADNASGASRPSLGSMRERDAAVWRGRYVTINGPVPRAHSSECLTTDTRSSDYSSLYQCVG